MRLDAHKKTTRNYQAEFCVLTTSWWMAALKTTLQSQSSDITSHPSVYLHDGMKSFICRLNMIDDAT
jgi:hypothetical protein